MVMIVEGPIRSSMYESVGTTTEAIERTETAESATNGPTRALGAAFKAEPYLSLLEDPEIAGWAREWSERHNVTALDALGDLAQALLLDALSAEASASWACRSVQWTRDLTDATGAPFRRLC